MRDFVNPSLLSLVVVLVACRVACGGAVADTCGLCILVVCCTAFVTDLALGLARAFFHRPALMKVVWAMVFLSVGSTVFLFPHRVARETDPEEETLQTLLFRYRKDPSFAQGEEMNELVITAASAGKVRLLREFLGAKQVAGDRELLSVATQTAAERGHVAVVRLLTPYISLNETRQGSTPLIAASASGKATVVSYLLSVGADPNLPDAQGTVPLIHAVLADSAPCVRLLMQSGACPSRCDADGRDAASYSRNEEVDALLEEKAPNLTREIAE